MATAVASTLEAPDGPPFSPRPERPLLHQRQRFFALQVPQLPRRRGSRARMVTHRNGRSTER
eukprot:13544881-Alexandrium_andersonii.AAC.1